MAAQRATSFSLELLAAARQYIRRQNRDEHPDGSFDRAMRWYPAGLTERCECCESVRSPSRAHPYSLLVHCRSGKHISQMHDVSEKELMQCVRAIRRGEVQLAA